MSKRRKASALGDLPDQHSQRPWTDYRAQMKLQDTIHTDRENRLARRACRMLVEGNPSWREILGER